MRAAARAEAARAAGLEVGLEVVEKVVVKVEAMAAAETAAAMEAAVAAEWAAASAAMARRPDGGGARIARVEAWTMACALIFSGPAMLALLLCWGCPLGVKFCGVVFHMLLHTHTGSRCSAHSHAQLHLSLSLLISSEDGLGCFVDARIHRYLKMHVSHRSATPHHKGPSRLGRG